MADERYSLDQRIDHVTDQSLDATRRIRQVSEDTHKTGVETLITLNEQGEQLDNIERRQDEINVDLKRTGKNLTELEKCCGCCTCLCTRPSSYKKDKQYKKVYGKKAQQREREWEQEDVITEQPTGGRGQGPFIKKVTNDAREDEMEENLQ